MQFSSTGAEWTKGAVWIDLVTRGRALRSARPSV